MDVDAIQLLNLSPIPELSELELSTMMDQLSGLSDINGDFSDQHVENIIKEAEDLIDKSSSHKLNEVNNTKLSESEDYKSIDSSQDANELKSCPEDEFQDIHFSESKHYNTPVHSDHFITDAHGEGDVSKHFNSQVGQSQVKILSPGGSCNHIKSTIDSLKEFSTIIEKQLSSRSPSSSPKYSTLFKHAERDRQKEVTVSESQASEKSSNSAIIPISDSVAKKDVQAHDKSVKLLNCFERLYQSRPLRLTACKKPKVIDKIIPKTFSKKKLTKDLKPNSKTNKQGKNIKKLVEDSIINPVNDDIYQNVGSSFPRTSINVDLLSQSKVPSAYSSNTYKCVPPSKSPQRKTSSEILEENLKIYPLNKCSETCSSNMIQQKIDENLILKVLKEVEEIKDQVKKVGVFGEQPSPEKSTGEDQGTIDNLKSEVESVREKVTSVSNAGIKRLQEQFSLLKFKYYQQMDKLEAENLKLREALHSQQKFFASRRNINLNGSPVSDTSFPPESRKHKTSVSSSPSSDDNKVSNDNSAPVTTPVATASKEAFSQTERESNSVSTQCSPAPSEEGKKETETKKAENKENVKCKPGRSKPFSDVGLQQLSRQKKLLDHESQLLATLRGLQTEMTAKDKENKRLKTEIESLKKQIKKLSNNKMENLKRSHAGTQTIGLGPCAQRQYTPEMYEVPKEFEQENEDLKTRIKALEEDFEVLKEKRINDLQSLHQVHEEEMAKLVSKLETQSSLTKHLHSLLVNR